MSCNMDCFNCTYADCINDRLTEAEVLESICEDRKITAEHSCEGSYRKQYYWKNVEKCRKQSRETYERRKDAKLEKSREYYHNNKARCLELNKRWRAEHEELVRQRQHEYYIRWRDKKRREGELSGG